MSIDIDEFEGMKIALSGLAKKTAALVKIQKEGNCANPDKPDYSKGCELLEKATRRLRRGGKRKSRKKRGKGLVSSKMRRKKHMSVRQPKQKYVYKAREILANDRTFLNADMVVQAQRERNLALELQDNDKKGGRRKRKSRRKPKRRKTKKKRRRSRKRRR